MLGLDDNDILDLMRIEKQLEKLERENFIDTLYPDKGTDGNLFGFRDVKWSEQLKDCWPTRKDEAGNEVLQEPKMAHKESWSRHLYPQQLNFFKQGANFTQRLLIAANRVGKSLSAGYEVACHATQIYPDWWEGLRFDRPIKIICAGVNTDQVRKVIQNKLLGPVGDFGTALIRKSCIEFTTLKEAEKADTFVKVIRVKTPNGAYSEINLMTYEMGVKAFMGFEADLIWLDEECPSDVYEECKTRLMTTGGKMLITFTPLEGMTDMIENYMGSQDFVTGPIIAKDGSLTSKTVVISDWWDVPHLTYSNMKDQLEGMPEFLRDAKSRGIPSLGSGAVYPVNFDSVFVSPFRIPAHWKRVFAIDFGWEDPTAILWGATNPEDNTTYIYAEHYQSKQVAAIHASVIKQKDKAAGFTIPGVADPSGGGRNSGDGKLTRDVYNNELDIHFESANNSIAPGLSKVRDMLVDGRLKIFDTCVNTKGEMKKYRYEKGKLKGADHAMDSLRYLVVSGLAIAKSEEEVNFTINYNSNSVYAS